MFFEKNKNVFVGNLCWLKLAIIIVLTYKKYKKRQKEIMKFGKVVKTCIPDCMT